MVDKERLAKAWKIFRDSNPYQICSGKEFRAIREPEYCMGQMIEDTLKALQEVKIFNHGHWIMDPNGMDWNIPAWVCSECGHRHIGLPIMGGVDEKNIYRFAGSQFCPNCGAVMDRR